MKRFIGARMKQYTRFLPSLALILSGAFALPPAASADDVSAAQRRGAAEYLAAVAGGSVQPIAYAIHPDELDRLRVGILAQLREEAARGDGTRRARLFGALPSVQDVERLTSLNFFQAVARRGLVVRSRPYEELKGLTAVRDGNLVHVVVKGVQAKERGKTAVVEVVSLLPYGKDWKAAIPGDIEAQIEDLMEGRGPSARAGDDGNAGGNGGGRAGAGQAAGQGAGAATGGVTAAGATATAGGAGNGAGGATARNFPEILTMLAAAEKALIDGRCDAYYKEYLSPSFRKTLSSKALGTLISGCRNGLANRELLIAALRIVRRLPPRYEYDDSRATYDVSGQGLPFDQYALEKVEGRWYIAE